MILCADSKHIGSRPALSLHCELQYLTWYFAVDLTHQVCSHRVAIMVHHVPSTRSGRVPHPTAAWGSPCCTVSLLCLYCKFTCTCPRQKFSRNRRTTTSLALQHLALLKGLRAGASAIHIAMTPEGAASFCNGYGIPVVDVSDMAHE